MLLPAVKMLASCLGQEGLACLRCLTMDTAPYAGYPRAFQTCAGRVREYKPTSVDAGILLNEPSDIQVGTRRRGGT